ncbi:hypothetical protein RchiOBHm_Chr5g0072211 [Rosa chinensis]|uniref:Uncharacterized protein n=1 Tax=Rosa chinensis TaxID=74649 RepID=A0A2P6QKL4_ROSCH|nr:hypothetical protein RchiOBHm_Chr5g0072211 [Rosa chinensis]
MTSEKFRWRGFAQRRLHHSEGNHEKFRWRGFAQRRLRAVL